MPVLNIAEQIALGRKHGFTDAELPDLCAVIATESGGDTQARQPNGMGRGLVQIDLGQHPDVTEAQAYDPDFAMSFARALSRNASGLGPTNWYGPRDHPDTAAQARSDARAVLGQEASTVTVITRDQWGARPATTSTNITPDGVAVHWEGPGMGSHGRDEYAGIVRGIQAFHMDGNGWADIAYTYLVSPCGDIFEGRGPGHRTAANGTDDANQRFYAVCYIAGEGDPFTDEGKRGIDDAIGLLGGGQIVGHRDLTQTSCPGDVIYAWVHSGHPSGPPAPCEQQSFAQGDTGDCVSRIQAAVGVAADGDFGPATDAAVRAFQRSHGLTDDGVVGPATWAAIQAPAPAPAPPSPVPAPPASERPPEMLIWWKNGKASLLLGSGKSIWITSPEDLTVIRSASIPECKGDFSDAQIAELAK